MPEEESVFPFYLAKLLSSNQLSIEMMKMPVKYSLRGTQGSVPIFKASKHLTLCSSHNEPLYTILTVCFFIQSALKTTLSVLQRWITSCVARIYTLNQRLFKMEPSD